MTYPPRMQLWGIVLDAPDAEKLASFYERFLGWSREKTEPGWVKLTSPVGGPGLSFQTEPRFVRPVWPPGPGDPQMSVHLDIRVDDMATASAHALASGAELARYQPTDDVRVFLDPAGHPFCLFLN